MSMAFYPEKKKHHSHKSKKKVKKKKKDLNVSNCAHICQQTKDCDQKSNNYNMSSNISHQICPRCNYQYYAAH